MIDDCVGVSVCLSVGGGSEIGSQLSGFPAVWRQVCSFEVVSHNCRRLQPQGIIDLPVNPHVCLCVCYV